MRIIFVRHGEPDYEHDCLTPAGRLQAAAAAERLAPEGISKIYSSINGRAQETAGYTARRLGLPVTVLPWMHEISWGGPGLPENGHPWTLSDRMIDLEGYDFAAGDWRKHPYFQGNVAVEYYDMIAGELDKLLAGHGYRHEQGVRFACETDQQETIDLFSHGGSGGCALAHLLALPFPYVTACLTYDFTSVIILSFPVRKGGYVHPRLELFNDTAHIRTDGSGPKIQQVSE